MSDKFRLVAAAAIIALTGGCASFGGSGADSSGGDQSADAASGSGTGQTAEAASSSANGQAAGNASGSEGETQTADSNASAGSQSAGPQLGSGKFEPTGVSEFDTSDTFVGQKVKSFAGELRELQSKLASHNQRLQKLRQQARQRAQSYQDRIAQITAKLQTGTTPGNPELVQLWQKAQQDLEKVQTHITALNNLQNKVSGNAAMAAYLLDSVRAAYALSGAVEKDHRQLKTLEDEVNRTIVQIERLSSELSKDITRSSRYIRNERSNLRTLSLSISRGELLGGGAGGFTLDAGSGSGGSGQRADLPQAPAANRFGEPQVDRRVADRPLVVIRFQDPTVEFAQPLYQAVSDALDRRPQARFELVAVAPDRQSVGQASLAASQVRENAERVRRTLLEMGMPAERIVMTETRSSEADVNQVHVYVQ